MSVQGATFGGSEHVNQDRWGFADGHAWVLDGATKRGFEHGRTSVGAFVDLLDDSLRRAIRAGTPSLRELLRTAVAATAAQWADRPRQSATIAMARRGRAGGQWLVLCDAALAHGDGELITDATLARVRAEEHARLERTHPATDPGRARQMLFQAVEARRDVLGGFWTVSLDPDVADRALVGELPVSGPVALMSDGLTDGLVHGYWDCVGDAFRDWTSATPHEVLERYRLWLLDRSAPFDDVTLVTL